MAPKDLNFITGNKNKLAEVQAILSPTAVNLQSQAIDLPELQGTIEEISTDKAKRAAERVQGPVLVEDTCLCFNAFNELPGPYVYVHLRALTHSALRKQTPLRIAHAIAEADKLPGILQKWFLQALGVQQFHKLLAGFEDKSAQAVCTFAYCEGPGHEPIVFQGRTDGMIVPARGPTDFGWDACFEYEGQTYAEMPKEEKNKISHRGRALAKLVEWLKQEV
ncbi:nucleoside triphosphate pyrophosphohydrolase ham1 [Friedmanniomyces endolithicus]|uniref:Inosine triphosphate pyrophosphatase n=1 Tax=Friedmanniomyces endolithicus TaxID=329885 RepID=A0AAN6QW13_9PEZI|nr:nucleoside triphosphate pyrophosphohydrolase ham1 [Friedmanniomyces endolithicus]KAK0814821.1 nucleoside triphosphate pyrophosphohydrolase ham1 [Friedmanniomyces endolithicus]KAK0815096.1 nucleoside triphosphate pyrophosphohydrolase ham1 [Friedmanniomyces endolithicus]KAK0869833.1 nucleoside triphosphate pyrophosphohydrolase ham1 [Friedmanniomyces endolithicus]KAK0915051.1 nucleoside triphosphate pyrophosphohydrolase ham1 [Friedmanniomyces endolithicus]